MTARVLLPFRIAIPVFVALAIGPGRLLAQAGDARPAALLAAGRGRPWVSLRDGRPVPTTYSGDANARQALRANQAKPLALAAADFNEDGVPDLACGFAAPDGSGVVTVHRGNVAALWAYGAAIRNGEPAPFHADARVFAVPEQPDFLAAGDFDGDGH